MLGRKLPCLLGGALYGDEPSMIFQGQGLVAKPPVMGTTAST